MVETSPGFIPYSVKVNGREYKLCVKRDATIGANTYFFTDVKGPIPDGAKTTHLPSHYEVTINRGFPVSRRKSS